MAGRKHSYTTRIVWTGNRGAGTADYRAYERAHELSAAGKPTIAMSSAPAFRGDKARHNPEDLLVASLSSCHMLWYLHMASEAGVRVVAYEDEAVGTMAEDAERGGFFERVVLRPRVTVASADMAEAARTAHKSAHHKCYIANSVNFPVEVEPEIIVAAG